MWGKPNDVWHRFNSKSSALKKKCRWKALCKPLPSHQRIRYFWWMSTYFQTNNVIFLLPVKLAYWNGLSFQRSSSLHIIISPVTLNLWHESHVLAPPPLFYPTQHWTLTLRPPPPPPQQYARRVHACVHKYCIGSKHNLGLYNHRKKRRKVTE